MEVEKIFEVARHIAAGYLLGRMAYILARISGGGNFQDRGRALFGLFSAV